VAVLRSLTMLVYGGSGAGKSSLANTAPYPRLMLDIEGGHRFLRANIKYWDPYLEAPPIADGTWDTCVVIVNNYDTVLKAYEYLRSGQHQFKSLIIDSISELQVKLFDKLAGNEQVKMQQWGEVLRHLGNFMRNIRDLTTHPTAPLEAIVITAMAQMDKIDNRYHPYLQGQLKTIAPYLYDIVGALVIETYQNPDPTQPPYKVRRLYVEGTPQYEAKERVSGRLGAVVEEANLNVETMLNMVFGPRPDAPIAAPAATAE
jgi:hypothetical protein